MKKILLKFWIEGVKGLTDSVGKHHHVALKVVPDDEEYFGLKIPFVHISAERMAMKTNLGDYKFYQPIFNMYVKSYEIDDKLSDRDWDKYIELRVEERLSNIKLRVLVKNINAVQSDERNGALCVDAPEIIEE